jgi:ribosomal-protein-serine acetyltransferase
MFGMDLSTLPKKIIGPRLVLKSVEPSYAQAMFNVIDKERERLSRFLLWVPSILSLEDENAYIVKSQKEWEAETRFVWALFNKKDETFMGTISAFNVRKAHRRCEIGYYLSSEFEGKGFLSEALRLLEKEFFVQGMERLQLLIRVNNERSYKAALRNGYTCEGRLRHMVCNEDGVFEDMFFLSKLRSEFVE